MSEVLLEYLVTLRLSREEFRLVGLALAGRLPERQRAAAAELNARLLRQQAHSMEESLSLVTAALTRATEPGETPPAAPPEE